MLKKIMVLSAALVVAPCLSANDLNLSVETVDKSGVCKTAVTFFKDHKTAFVVTAVAAACSWYAYSKNCFKKN